MAHLRIGLDFDNTLIEYDAAFAGEAARRNLPVQGARKPAVKQAALETGGERLWMEIQGQVYGRHIGDAQLIAGVSDFIHLARSRGVELFIVSHKTEYGHYDDSRTNLRDAARNWMASQRFFAPVQDGGFEFTNDHVFFAATRDEKIDRIAALECDWFIDDLPVVLNHEAFPKTVKRVLLSSDKEPDLPDFILVCATWRAIKSAIFGE